MGQTSPFVFFERSMNVNRNTAKKGVAKRRAESVRGGLLVAVLVTVLAVAGALLSRSVTPASATDDDVAAAASKAEKTVDVTFKKVWQGDAGHEDERPDSVTLMVTNSNTGEVAKQVVLSVDNGWTAKETLPYVKDGEGRLAYTVVEKDRSESYDVEVQTMTNGTGKGLELWTLATDSRISDGATIVLTNGNSGDVQLYKAEGPTDGVMSGTQRIITDPLELDGKTYNAYCRIGADADATVKDSLGWTVIEQNGGFILKNNMLKADPQLNRDAYLTINKKGELKLAGSASSATVFTYDASRGSLTGDGVTLYGYAFTDDSSLSDYVSTITVTNTYVQTDPPGPEVKVGDGNVTLNASKTWDDNNDAEGKRPDYVDLTVLANGQPALDADGNVIKVRVSAESGWKGTVEGLPKCKNGQKISYSVSEGSVPDGYTSTVSAPVERETDEKTFWVQATTFGTSAADEDTYLVVARDVDNPNQWLGMHVEGKNASWTNKEGHHAPTIPINNQPLTIDTCSSSTTYQSWVPDEVVRQHTDCLWRTKYDGVDTDNQSGGTFHNFFLQNVKTGKYLKCNGQGDLVDTPKQGECSFHYGIPLNAQHVTLKNPKEEYPYVLGNMKHYYILNNNHTGDGGATHSSVVRIYKQVKIKSYVVDVAVTNKYETPKGSITIKKIDQQGNKLPGAKFALYCSEKGSGEKCEHNGVSYYKVFEGTTDADGGLSFKGLKANGSVSYLLVETEAPGGYEPIEPVVFTLPVPRNGARPDGYVGNSTTSGGVTYYYDVTYTAVDKMSVILPQTDGPGILPLATVGIGAMGVGVAAAWSCAKSSKKRKE